MVAAGLVVENPVVDIVVADSGGTGLSFKPFYCSFATKSYARQKPDESTAKISNLSDQGARYVESGNLVLIVNAGNGTPGHLFRGAISRDGVDTQSNGPDRVTTIKAASGRRAYRDARFTKSYPAGTAVRSIINDVAVAMNKPVTVQATLPDFRIPTGWNFSHLARAALDEILLPFGLTWTITSGVLYIIDPLKAAPGNAPLIKPNTGLWGGVQRTKKGFKFATYLDPRIIAGRAVRVETRLFSGTGKVQMVSHAGNTWGTEWKTSAECTNV